MPNVTAPTSTKYRGWFSDMANDLLEAYHGTTRVFGASATALTLDIATTITGVLTASGVLSASSDVRLTTGRLVELLTNTDVDAQNNTLTAAHVVAGILTHTSVTGAGTVTTDTATAYVAGSGGLGALTYNGATIRMLYINDGTQTLTFSAGTGVTLGDVGQTIGADESAMVFITRLSATTVLFNVVGA